MGGQRLRSKANKAWLPARMLRRQSHRRKPKGKPISEVTSRADGKKSRMRARVEHVFAHQKNRDGIIRTVSLAPAEAKLTLENIAYNMDRLVFHERRLV